MGLASRSGKVDIRARAGIGLAMLALLPFPDISPEIFSVTLFGMTFALRWYALAYIVGILIGWWVVLQAVKSPRLWPAETPVMTREQVDDLLTWVILGVIVGGRLGYVMFYQPAYFLSNPLEIPKVWTGGMSFHGGALGVIIATWFYTGKHSIPRISAGDLVVLGIWPGLLLGRLANFINAELWGRPTDLPWGVAFPTEAAQFCPEVAGICARHPSQLYEAILEGVVLGVVLLWLGWRKGALKRSGLLMGTFLAGYGIARFAVEFVRQPDELFVSPGNPVGLALHVGGYGLTMGQLLCVPMIAVGLWLIRRA